MVQALLETEPTTIKYNITGIIIVNTEVTVRDYFVYADQLTSLYL